MLDAVGARARPPRRSPRRRARARRLRNPRRTGAVDGAGHVASAHAVRRPYWRPPDQLAGGESGGNARVPQDPSRIGTGAACGERFGGTVLRTFLATLARLVQVLWVVFRRLV